MQDPSPSSQPFHFSVKSPLPGNVGRVVVGAWALSPKQGGRGGAPRLPQHVCGFSAWSWAPSRELDPVWGEYRSVCAASPGQSWLVPVAQASLSVALSLPFPSVPVWLLICRVTDPAPNPRISFPCFLSVSPLSPPPA